eukprot:623972-Amphidinium_carterae.1
MELAWIYAATGRSRGHDLQGVRFRVGAEVLYNSLLMRALRAGGYSNALSARDMDVEIERHHAHQSGHVIGAVLLSYGGLETPNPLHADPLVRRNEALECLEQYWNDFWPHEPQGL